MNNDYVTGSRNSSKDTAVGFRAWFVSEKLIAAKKLTPFVQVLLGPLQITVSE